MQQGIEDHNQIIERIIQKYFSRTKSDISIIKKWFDDVTIEFFTEYRYEWVASHYSTSHKNKMFPELEVLVNSITRKINTIDANDKKWLISQYIKFFYDNDKDVESILWDYGICAFSSFLITSSTSADSLSIEALSNSKFIVDTNILLYLQLEEDEYSESYKLLENIFDKLNISTFYLSITRKEYQDVIAKIAKNTLKVIRCYDEELLNKTNDPYIKTAINRQCRDYEDYERFFNNLSNIPNYFVETIRLQLLEEKFLDEIFENSNNNETLQNKINNIYKNNLRIKISSNGNKNNNYYIEKLNKGKRKGALLHDAVLIAGTEWLRETEKCFILTRDSTMKQYGKDFQLRDNPPLTIGLDTLIGILAINNGGTDIDPTNFKPLFANLIKLSLYPERKTFQIEDLANLYDIQAQIADLPNDDVINLANDFKNNMLCGMDEENVKLNVQRSFQAVKIKLSTELKDEKMKSRLYQQENEKQKKYNEKSIRALRSEIEANVRQENGNKIRKTRLWWFFGVPLLISSIIFGILYISKLQLTNTIGDLAINLFASFIFWFLGTFTKIRSKINSLYKDESKINEEVEKRLHNKLNQ